jgi:hypothetical protein
MRALARLTILSPLLILGLPCGAEMSPTATEVQVGPVDVTQDIQGVAIIIPVTSFVAVQTAPTGITVSLRSFGNLADLQGKIGSIIDTLPLPKDNCHSYSGNNPVVSIYTKRLSLEGSSAVLTVSGDVDLWDCRENPIPNSKLEWVDESWLGVKVRRPKVVTWPGDPIKNKLLTQPVTARLPASLAIQSETAVQLAMESPQVDLGGQPALAAARDSLLNLFRINVNALAERALRSAVDPAKLSVAIPEELRKLNPKITKAEFVNIGALGVEFDAQAVVTTSALSDLLKALAEHQNPR